MEHIEYLPVMDHRNRSIPAESVTSFDVNKAIQRSLTKACARHGLGLYIYAGEDLPESEVYDEGAARVAAYDELVELTSPNERDALVNKYGPLQRLGEQDLNNIIIKIRKRRENG